MNKKRPKHLALHTIKLPLPGLISILHRVSGLVLFFSLPLILWLFQSSLHSIETYTQLKIIFYYPLSKIILLGLAWFFFHHFCAGIRYLGLDFHMGTNLKQARSSSRWVLVAGILLTILAGSWLC